MTKKHPNGRALPSTPPLLLGSTQGAPSAPPEPATRPTYSPAFPLAEASDWIRRWREADGGFYCHPQPDGSVMVQLAYRHGKGAEAIEEAIDRIQPLQDELLGRPDLKSAVITLIADTWAMASRPPAGSA